MEGEEVVRLSHVVLDGLQLRLPQLRLVLLAVLRGVAALQPQPKDIKIMFSVANEQ